MFHFRDWKGSTALVRPQPLNSKLYTRDSGLVTYDKAAYDSAGAFLVGELEKLDSTIHEPLVQIEWTRDVPLRDDVDIGHTSSSYTVSSFAISGGVTPGGINWATTNNTAIPRPQLDLAKIVNPLDPINYEVAYTIMDLEQARQTARSIDTQYLAAMSLQYQMNVDQIAYIGDANKGTTGLVNAAAVTNVASVAADGTGSATAWSAKTADQILRDINELLVSVWAATGYAVPPGKLLIAPGPFGYISTTKVSSAGNETILSYLKTRNVMTAERDLPLEIRSSKWLAAANRPGATSDRMAAYTYNREFARLPLVPIRPFVTQYEGVWIKVPYYGRLGAVETVYPETLGYRDGIG